MNKLPEKSLLMEILSEISNNNPTKKITRTLFEELSGCSRYSYEKQFGSFTQFLIETGLKENKYFNKIRNDVAKYSSLDKVKELNVEKIPYADKYNRELNNNRYKTVIFASDFHDEESDQFSVDVFLDSIKRIKPDCIILGGDILDLYDFSSFTKDPRKFNIISSIKWLHDLLSKIRLVTDCQIDYICGNHEERILKHLANQSPQITTLLSDLHGFTLSTLLGLDKYEINFISHNDLAAFKPSKSELAKNYVIKYESVTYTHEPNSKYCMNTIYGHIHSFKMDSEYNVLTGPYQLIRSGCMCNRSVEYAHNTEHWQNGFVISHIDTLKKTAQNVIIDTTNSIVEVGGKYYYREE